MKVKNSYSLNSYAIRSFAIFAAGFFFVTTLLTAFVIIPKINESIESQYLKDSQMELMQEAELFTLFVESQKTILQVLAKSPSLSNAFILSHDSNIVISDLLNNVFIGSEKSHLVLQDIEGNILIQTGNNLKGIYEFDQSWIKQVLERSIPYHFQLLEQDRDRFTFQMSIPVVYEEYIKGILSAEITVPLSQVFVTQTFNKHVAFRLSQGQSTIFTPFDHLEIANENSIELDLPDLTFIYIKDDAPIREKARSLRNTILLVLLVGLAVSFILFALLGYRSFVNNDKALNIQRPFWLVYAMPILVGGIGIGISIAGLSAILNIQQSSLEAKLIADSKVTIQSLREKVNSKLQMLDSIRAFYDASNDMNRLDFKIFTHPFLDNNPNIQAIEWIPYVQHNNRSNYELQARVDGLEDFVFREKNSNGQLIPSPNRVDYYPVYFVEPLIGNEKALGFDLSSNDQRFAALLKARDTGKPVATVDVILEDEQESQAGILLFYAVYNNLVPLNDVAGRLSQLKGFVVLVLKVEDMVRQSIGYELNSQTVLIQDITEANASEVIFGHAPSGSAFSRSETLNVAGITWKITTYSTLSKMPLWWLSWLVFISGLVLTALIVVGLVNLIRRREVVEQLVAKRTAELRMLSLTVANSNDVFIITEANELNLENLGPRIIYVNEAFTRVTGYSAKEAIGKTPRVLQGKNTDKKEIDKIRNALAKGEPYFGELINYGKDGKEYWVEINISPLKDENGKVTHFASVERDITERKQAQQEREQLISRLSESNELNDAILSSSVHLIIATDPRGVVTLFNQAAEKGLGYTSAEVVGIHSPSLWHDAIEIESKAAILSKELGKQVEAGFEVFVVKPNIFGREIEEWTLTRKNGTSFTGSLTTTCIRNKNDEITGYLAVIEVITER